MKKKNLKILISLSIPIILLISFVAYIVFIIPQPLGKAPEIQYELFEQPNDLIPIDNRYIYKSASELAAMIKNGKASSVDIVSEHIAYIKNNYWRYKALVWLDKDKAMEIARIADEAVVADDTLKALLGVPVTIKEQYFV